MFWVLLTSLLPVTAALQWTDSPTNHTQMASCSNSDIHLPGNFTLPPGETLVEIVWLKLPENDSEEIMAISIGGYLHPMTAFIGRVQGLGQTALTINPSAGLKATNYSIVVRTVLDGNTYAKYSKTITVTLTDPPTAESGRLKVRQDSEAIYDNTTGEWRVQLTCGLLTDLGHPAVSVVWTTPEGHTLNSSGQDNGTFRLFIPNPPSGGNYTCTLPPLSPATLCLPPDSPLLEGASVNVDEVKARLTLLEAGQRETETWKRLTKAKQKEVLAYLDSRNDQQQEELFQVESVALLPARLVRDCDDVRQYKLKSGVVNVYPVDNIPLQVYCDQDTDGGGWLVFQRRQDDSVDFYRNWTSYQKGFGDVTGNFWLGLDALHMLTTRQRLQRYELRVDLMKSDGEKAYATYSNFSVNDSSNYYRLSVSPITGGTAGDSLAVHNNRNFSTFDADHNEVTTRKCAIDHHGAWWYNNCHASHLNGVYKIRSWGYNGVVWYSFDKWNSLKFAEMKLRKL